MDELRKPWMVAAWPGMGLVAHLAIAHLMRKLGAEHVVEVPPDDHFDLTRVEVRGGMLLPLQLPRTSLFGWRDPKGRRDLVLLVGERQPTSNVRSFCDTTVELARGLGVERVVTFAAMASPALPSAPARVLLAATDSQVRAEARAQGLALMEKGEIGGLNGVFLAAAAERGLPGACLLGEFPYFASAIPNPKASAAVLRAFARLSGLELDLTEIDRQAAHVERQLSALKERLEEAARRIHPAAGFSLGAEEAEQEQDQIPADWPRPEREEPREQARRLSPRDEAHLESLFAESEHDRRKATELKAELDRLDVFERYEDRFLDLFKQAE